jgi:hypothetical protein
MIEAFLALQTIFKTAVKNITIKFTKQAFLAKTSPN